MSPPIKMTPSEFEAKFGYSPTPTATSSAPVRMTPSEFQAQYGYTPSQENQTLSALMNDPIGSLTSKDWWMTRPDGKKLGSVSEAAAPVISKTLNSILPFGDEALAGLMTLGGDDYEQTRDRIREQEAMFQREHPYLSFGLDVLGAYKLPFKSKVAEKTGILGKAAQAGKESAGLAALYGSGRGEGDTTTEGIKNRLLLGGGSAALAYPLAFGTTAAVETGKQLWQGGKSLYQALTKEPEVMTGEALYQTAGDDLITMQVADDVNELYKYRTPAEITGNRALAKQQRILAKSENIIDDVVAGNEATRRVETRKLLEKPGYLADDIRMDVEARAKPIQRMYEGNLDKATKKIDKLYNSIPKSRAVWFGDAKQGIARAFKDKYQAGGMPGELASIVDDISKVPDMQHYGYVDALRKRLGRVAWELKQANNKEASSLAVQALKYIDDAITKTHKLGAGNPASNMLTKNQADTYFKARELASKTFDRFGVKKGVGSSISDSPFASRDKNLVKNLWDGSREKSIKLIEGTDGSPEQIDSVRAMVRDYLLEESVDNNGLIKPERFRTLLRKWRPGLEAKPQNGPGLFEPSHLQKLDQVLEEMNLVSTQGDKSVKNLTYNASRGESTTAQTMLMEGANSFLPGGKLPFLGRVITWLDKAAVKVGDSKRQAMLKLYADAIDDPALMRSLAKKGKLLTERDANVIINKIKDKWFVPKEPDVMGRIIGGTSASLVPTVDKDAKRIAENYSPIITPSNNTGEATGGGGASGKVQQPTAEPTPTPITVTREQLRTDKKALNTYVKSLDPVLQAIIKVESKGNPKAVSKAGARGIMQLMPRNVRVFGVSDPFDPYESIQAGIKLLNEEVQRFGGDLKLVLAAYNAGSPAVNRAIKKAGSKSWNDIYPHLPAETKKYVPKVLRALREIA